MTACHCEFYILQFKSVIVVFTSHNFLNQSFSILTARQLLYGIAEDLTPEDVKSVKFLLQKQIPKNKLHDNAVYKVILIIFLQG